MIIKVSGRTRLAAGAGGVPALARPSAIAQLRCGKMRTGAASTEQSDEVLLAGLGGGDPDLAVTFVRRFQRIVFGVAQAVTGDPATAEDVAQRAFEQAWRHASVYESRRGAVRTWLTAITRNLAIDALRLRRAVPTDPDDFAAFAMASFEHNPEDAVRRGDARETVTAALRVLPEEQRRAVVLAAVYGRTALEISESEGIPLGTAKTRIRTALIRLRAAVEPAEGRRDE